MANPQQYVQLVSSGSQGRYHMIFPFDGIAEADGSSQFTTLQAADDELDSAAYSLYVKQGTFAAGFTVSTNNAYIFVEPGTVIQAAITLSGTGITLVLGAECDVQGLITISGNNCSLICQNGVDIDGIAVSGDTCLVDGGGWDTLVDGGTTRRAIAVTGSDVIVQNIASQTTPTPDPGNNFEAYHNTSGVRNTIRNVKVVDSDYHGITVDSQYSLIEGCTVLGADNNGINVPGPSVRVIGNFIIAVGGDGIGTAGGSDNMLVVGNIIKDHGAQGIDINASAEDCCIVGNRVDDLGTDPGSGVVDNSGTSTASGNEETAF
jgi:hypothetical protein